jgi:hypothetical protein
MPEVLVPMKTPIRSAPCAPAGPAPPRETVLLQAQPRQSIVAAIERRELAAQRVFFQTGDPPDPGVRAASSKSQGRNPLSPWRSAASEAVMPRPKALVTV